MAQREFTQIFPKPGWVEHNPHEIWSSQASVIAEAIAAIDINGLNIAGIGILRKEGHEVKATTFMKYGVPFTLAAVITGYLLIWLIWKP